MKSLNIDAVYVSSDRIGIQEKVESSGAIFVPRTRELCDESKSSWSAVVRGVLQTIPEDDETFIVWCPVTSPLFMRFDDVIQKLKENVLEGSNSITTVTAFNHYYLDSRLLPINHQWGSWHQYSQKNFPIFQLNWACSIASKQESIDCGYQIGSKPSFYPIDQFEGLDIDTPEEFDLAKYLFEQKT
jgi:CMP-N-acetylneuraminic acid synthetase